MEFWRYLQDISTYWRVFKEKRALQRPGAGFDYLPEMRQARELIHRLHPKRMRLKVENILHETPSTKTLRLRPIEGWLPPFRAGQYVNVFVDVDGVLTSRPYSISSPEDEEYIDLTIRLKPEGFVSPYLFQQVKEGDELETSGPAGHFYYEPLIHGNELVFIAGGSGITPCMSIIRTLLKRGEKVSIDLIYGSRSPEDVIFGEELLQLAQVHPHFRYTLVISEPPPGYSQPSGFIDEHIIKESLQTSAGHKPIAERMYFLCGPNEMYAFCCSALARLGVPQHRIRREVFSLPGRIEKEPGWPQGLSPQSVVEVKILGGKAIRTIAGEPLLNALERYGILLPAICRAGECSACRIRLVSGKVFQPAHAKVRQADAQFGFIHACVSYPLEDLTICL